MSAGQGGERQRSHVFTSAPNLSFCSDCYMFSRHSNCVLPYCVKKFFIPVKLTIGESVKTMKEGNNIEQNRRTGG